jgi:epoxyqueuosine reductase
MADPRHALPEAKSLVVAVYDYATAGFPAELVGKIGRVYQSRCYLAPADRLHGARPRLLRQFLERAGCRVGPWEGARTGVPERQAAARAGVAQFGRNNFACTPGVGTFVIIHTYLVDRELAYDEPSTAIHCPPKCRLCREACPTGALTEDLRLNPRLCVAFNTFTTRGEENGISVYIPREIRAKMGSWVHGCDVCQEVCPKNQRKLKANLPVDAFLAKKASEFDLVSLLRMSDEYYRRVVQPMMYNYIRDQSLFRRNAAIALGNSGDRRVAPALAAALDDPSEVVRAHAAWALGRLGGRRAREALQAARGREAGEKAAREIEEALAIE